MFVETILDRHEYRHPADDDPAYNESTYYNFACAESGITGWLRVALQVNQPAAQASVLLFRRGGETLFDYHRTTEVSADELRVGTLLFDIIEPHRKQRLSFAGSVAAFADPRDLLSPSQAFRAAPRRDLVLDLTVEGDGRSFGMNGDDPDNRLEESMCLGHFEQFIIVSGSATIDGERVELHGAGLRDHSWGPRDWAGPLYYRWITATLSDGASIMVLFVQRRDGGQTREAALVRDGKLVEIEVSTVDVEWTPDGFGRVVTCEVTTPDGPILLTATAREPEQFAPLRHHRRDSAGALLETRIGYAPYDFVTDDGRTGIGMVEILDQLAGGLPVSMRVAAPAAGTGR